MFFIEIDKTNWHYFTILQFRIFIQYPLAEILPQSNIEW